MTVLQKIILIFIFLIIYAVFIFLLSYPTQSIIDATGGSKSYDIYT